MFDNIDIKKATFHNFHVNKEIWRKSNKTCWIGRNRWDNIANASIAKMSSVTHFRSKTLFKNHKK